MRTPIQPIQEHVVIVGGGFGGLECARQLANRPAFRVTLIDRANHNLFQPLLYQVATASLAAPDIARSIRQILETAENVTVLMDEVISIDPASKTLRSRSGTRYGYDTLVLAAGARNSYFGHDDWAKHTLGIKTLADARLIRRSVLSNLEQAELCEDPERRRRLMTVAIVGGGPTGVELAGAFAAFIGMSVRESFRRIDTSQLKVVLIEASDRLLSPYDSEQSEYARRRLEKLGVEVRTGSPVEEISPGNVRLGDGSTIETGAIIWAAGVRASALTGCLGCEVDRAGCIEPAADLSVPGCPGVYAIGDLVHVKDQKGEKVPGVAPAAVQMGRHVAGGRIAGHEHGKGPAFRYRDKGIMAIIGKNCAVVKSGPLRLRGITAWLAWLFIHLLLLVGFRNKLVVLIGWAWAYVRNRPDARIIVEPATEEGGTGGESGSLG